MPDQECRQSQAPPRIVIEAKHGRVEATLWLRGVAVDGHSDSTGTLTTRQLVAPLIERFDMSMPRNVGVADQGARQSGASTQAWGPVHAAHFVSAWNLTVTMDDRTWVGCVVEISDEEFVIVDHSGWRTRFRFDEVTAGVES